MVDEIENIPSSCEISKGSFGINPKVVDPTSGDGLGFENREGTDIKITQTIENGKKIFTFSYNPYKPPTITSTVTPAVAEIGQIVGTSEAPVNFHVRVLTGREEIILYQLTPNDAGVAVDDDFKFSKTQVTSDEAGLFPGYEMLVKDTSGTEVRKRFGVNFQHRYYQGYSHLDSLDEAKIKGLQNSKLGDSILSLFGGKRSYTTPNTAYLNYIYWVFPVGTAEIKSAILSGLPFPIKRLADVAVTNQYGKEVTYAVVRSDNKFGYTTLDITLS